MDRFVRRQHGLSRPDCGAHNVLARFRAWWHRLPPADVVFIHINKTGGSSIERALMLPFEHKTALEKIHELGRSTWEQCFRFSCVRNPWDRVVSHYHFRVQTNQTGLGVTAITFREWVRRSYGEHDPLYYDKPKMFMPQWRWISDEAGEQLVEVVCRFENLGEDFQKVCARIDRSVRLPHLKRSQRGQYRDYYDRPTELIVSRSFAEDVDRFGYRF